MSKSKLDMRHFQNPFGFISRGIGAYPIPRDCGPFPVPSGPILQIRSLGLLRISFQGIPLEPSDLKGAKNAFLLAFLALFAGRPISDETVMDALWDNKSKSNLYAACSHLRKTFQAISQDEEVLIREQGCLSLNPRVLRHDFDELKKLEDRMRLTPLLLLSKSNFLLSRRALKLYRGPYLSGCSLGWAQFPRNYAQRVMVELLESSLTQAIDLRRDDLVLDQATKLLEFEPTHGKGNLVLVEQLLKRGQLRLARRQMSLYLELCRQDLDCEPEAEVVAKFRDMWPGLGADNSRT